MVEMAVGGQAAKHHPIVQMAELKVSTMQWEEGQRVECEGRDWGACYVTLSTPQMVVIYCPRYEMVTTASPAQLEQAGWKIVRQTRQSKVVWLDQWKKLNHSQHHPLPQH